MKNRIFMLVPQVFNIADKLGIYSDDQTNMIEEYYLTSMKMVADMEGASKDSLEAAANQIKEESFDAIGRLAGFNLVYHLTGKNRLSIDQEGAETALPGVGAVAGAAAGVAAGAAAAAAAGAAGVVAATSTASTSGDYDDETIQNYRDLLKSLGWADENLSDETIKEMLSVMEKYNIDTKEKQCAFLAQVSWESGKGSKTLEDGDDAYFEGKAYGKKYRGGGYIHLTWEYGYQAFATYEILQNHPELQGSATYLNPANNGPDAIAKQYNALVEAAAAKGIDISEYTDIYDKGAEYVSENYAWESAAYFWDTGGCNEIIDNGGSIDDVSDVINHYDTGTFDERAEYYNTLMDNYSQYIGE